MDVVAEPLLLGTLRRDYGDHVFKFLAPCDAARLERALPSDLVFVAAGEGVALLRSVAGRRHAEAAKAGSTMLVPLGEEREGRVTWATELRWIYMAMGRLRVGGAKKMICLGHHHSLVASGKAGEVWSFGSGRFGQLGHRRLRSFTPRLVEALNHIEVRQVTAGVSHSMLLTSEGCVFMWGRGRFGPLGHGNTDSQNVPKRVEGLTNVTDISAGNYHSMAAGEGGAVYTWGYNRQGQLGLGDHGWGTNRLVPTEVPGVNGVVSVEAGSVHSFLLSRDGTAMVCGQNYAGQLGLGDVDDRDTFTVVPGLSGVVDIDAGRDHSIAVTAKGELYTWGQGWQIGHGGDDTTQRLVPTKVTGGGIDKAAVVQVAAGCAHTMALTAVGELYAWGDGYRGQLGHGGRGPVTVPRIVDGIGPVVSMSGGFRHSLVITGEGRVLAFGMNGEWRDEDSDDEELDEPVFDTDGRLGLGMGVREALTPTVIDGIAMGGAIEGKEGKE